MLIGRGSAIDVSVLAIVLLFVSLDQNALCVQALICWEIVSPTSANVATVDKNTQLTMVAVCT